MGNTQVTWRPMTDAEFALRAERHALQTQVHKAAWGLRGIARESAASISVEILLRNVLSALAMLDHNLETPMPPELRHLWQQKREQLKLMGMHLQDQRSRQRQAVAIRYSRDVHNSRQRMHRISNLERRGLYQAMQEEEGPGYAGHPGYRRRSYAGHHPFGTNDDHEGFRQAQAGPGDFDNYQFPHASYSGVLDDHSIPLFDRSHSAQIFPV